jgi:hypothetical protein
MPLDLGSRNAMKHFSIGRRVVTTAAALVTIAMTSATGAPALAASGFEASAQDSATQTIVREVLPARPAAHYLWVITSVGAAHTTYGSWRTCSTITPRSTASTATCSAGGSVSNTVSGGLGIGYSGLSANLGFNVTRSYSVTGSQSYRIPAHAGGKLQWRPVYSTRTVHQTRYYYSITGARSTVATATTQVNKYNSPTFRYVS